MLTLISVSKMISRSSARNTLNLCNLGKAFNLLPICKHVMHCSTLYMDMQQCIDFYFIFVIKWKHRIEKSLLSKCGSKMWNDIMLVEEFIKKKMWISRYIVSQISLENYFRGNRTQIQRKKDMLQIMTLVWYMLNIDVNVVKQLVKIFYYFADYWMCFFAGL